MTAIDRFRKMPSRAREVATFSLIFDLFATVSSQADDALDRAIDAAIEANRRDLSNPEVVELSR
jgi:hypothetical protein